MSKSRLPKWKNMEEVNLGYSSDVFARPLWSPAHPARDSQGLLEGPDDMSVAHTEFWRRGLLESLLSYSARGSLLA